MTSKSSKEKGDKLEDAVEAIEAAIIRTSPGFAEGNFSIEGKKIVKSEGVRHEIDLFVTASLGRGYEATFIFECKNWSKKVGKNEVIVLSEKVRATNAQKGYLIAHEFTKDAIGQAGKNPRIELLTVEELDPDQIELPGRFHGIQTGDRKANVVFHAAQVAKDAPIEPIPDLSKVELFIRDKLVDTKQYIEDWIKGASEKAINAFPSNSAEEGNHEVPFSEKRTFEASVAFANGVELQAMSLEGIVNVVVCKAVIVSAFDVATRGRSIGVKLNLPSAELGANFVQFHDPNRQ